MRRKNFKTIEYLYYESSEDGLSLFTNVSLFFKLFFNVMSIYCVCYLHIYSLFPVVDLFGIEVSYLGVFCCICLLDTVNSEFTNMKECEQLITYSYF